MRLASSRRLGLSEFSQHLTVLDDGIQRFMPYVIRLLSLSAEITHG